MMEPAALTAHISGYLKIEHALKKPAPADRNFMVFIEQLDCRVGVGFAVVNFSLDTNR